MNGPSICSYKHRPTKVTAIQWDGTDECLDMVKKMDTTDQYSFTYLDSPSSNSRVLRFYKSSALPCAHPGDYVVQDENGEMWPVHSSVFDRSYEKVVEKYPLTFVEAMQKLLDGEKVTNEYLESFYPNSHYKLTEGKMAFFRADYYSSVTGTFTGLLEQETKGKWRVVE